MKFGTHSYVFADRWSDSCLPFMDTARELNLECLEIGIGDDVTFSHSLARQRAEELHLTLVVSPGGQWPLEYDLSSEDAMQGQAGLAWHKTQVDKAAELGAVAYCGSIYGHPGVIRKRRPDPAEFVRTAEGLRALAEYAEVRGVKIVLEPMSHFRTHMVNTPDQVMRLIDQAGHPNLHVLLDTYHMITEVTDYGDAVRSVADRLWGIHACENNRGVPGRGLVPWDSVFEALADTGFDGYVVMESYNSALGDFAYERGMFHNVCPVAHSFLEEGLAFLKRGIREARSVRASRQAEAWARGLRRGAPPREG